MKPIIEEIDYGIGFLVVDKDKRYIQLNRNLRKYPKLRKQVLNHELKHLHTQSGMGQFMVDFKDSFNLSMQKGIISFCLRHPSALACQLPVMMNKGKISFNPVQIFNIVIALSVIGGMLVIAL